MISRHIYNALAQWADNTRNGFEECPDDVTANDREQLAAVEAEVEAYERALYRSIERPVVGAGFTVAYADRLAAILPTSKGGACQGR